MATELDEIIDDAKRTRAQSAMGERLRATPAPDLSELARRTTPTTPETAPAKVLRAVSLNPAQAPGSIADLSRPFVQQEAAPVSNPNVVKGMLSAEGVQAQNALRGTPAAPSVASPSVAAPVVEPAALAEAAPAKPSIYQRITSAASESARPLVPSTGSAGGAIAKVAGAAGTAGLTLARRAAPFVEPAIETARVARVALDPQATQLDVATQTAEGVGRTASTIAGVGLGGAAGAAIGGPFAPVTGAIGAIAGGAVGYIGGDQAIKALRRSVGLDSDSPVERSDARSAANPQAARPSGNVITNANGSTFTTLPNGTQVMTGRPTTEAKAAAPAAPAVAPTIAGVAAQTKASPTAGAARAPSVVAQGDTTPAIGEGAVEIYRGSQRSVAVPTAGGGYAEVDGSVYDAGMTQQALVAQGRDAAMTPIERAQLLERTKDENQVAVAGIQAASAGNVAVINERGSNYRADAAAESSKKNVVVIPGEEYLAPDGFTKLKKPSQLYDYSTGKFIGPPGTPGLEVTPDREAIRNNPKLSRDEKIKALKALDARQ